MTSSAGSFRLCGAAGACGQEVTFVVHDDTAVGLDALQVEFDDERVVSEAGIVLVTTLVERLGVEALAQRLVRLRRDRPGAANAGRKGMALLFAMVLGADSIDDSDVLRAGRTRGCWEAGCRRPRRWGRSCARSRSGTSVSSMRCSARHWSGRGRPGPGRVTGGW